MPPRRETSADSAARFLRMRGARTPAPRPTFAVPTSPDEKARLLMLQEVATLEEAWGRRKTVTVADAGEARVCPGCGGPVPRQNRRCCSAQCRSRLGGLNGGWLNRGSRR